MTDPTPTPAATPRVSTAQAAVTAMNEGGSDLAAYLLSGVCVIFAGVWAFIAYKSGHHDNFDDGLIGGCLLVALVFAAPANAQKAVAILKPILPWGRHGGDT